MMDVATYRESYSGKISRRLAVKQRVIDVAAGRRPADLVLKDSTYTRTEYLEWSISPRNSMLLDVSAGMGGGWTFGKFGKDYNTLQSGGDIEIRIEAKGKQSEIRSAHILEILDGEIRERTEVPVDEYGYYTAKSKDSYEVPFGTCFELAAEVVDQHGLVYRAIVHRWETDESGQLLDDMGWFGYGADIYNKDGELLYSERP